MWAEYRSKWLGLKVPLTREQQIARDYERSQKLSKQYMQQRLKEEQRALFWALVWQSVPTCMIGFVAYLKITGGEPWSILNYTLVVMLPLLSLVYSWVYIEKYLIFKTVYKMRMESICE